MALLPTLALFLVPFLQGEPDKAKQGEPKKGKETTPAPAAARGEKDKPKAEGGLLTFEVTTLDGKKVSNESLKGKVVLVDLWGTWCPPCRKAIPSLMKISEELAKKEVVVLGVAFEQAGMDKETKKAKTFDRDKAQENVKKFYDDQKMNYAVALGGQTGGPDVEKVFPTLKNVRSFPTLVLVGRDGKVRDIEIGFKDEETFSKFADMVRKAAEEPAPKAPTAGKSH